MKKKLYTELAFCLELWEKQEHCTFGEKTKCTQCGAPYILYKMLTGKVLHENRLSLEQWKKAFLDLKIPRSKT